MVKGGGRHFLTKIVVRILERILNTKLTQIVSLQSGKQLEKAEHVGIFLPRIQDMLQEQVRGAEMWILVQVLLFSCNSLDCSPSALTSPLQQREAH